jgi:hypothetical protein
MYPAIQLLNKINSSTFDGWFACTLSVTIRLQFEQANPVKAGDAKPRVYNRETGQDSQVTEDRMIRVKHPSQAGLSTGL